jgi:hypothetical protein
LPGGIRDLVTEEIGYKLLVNDTDAYVDVILKLNADRQLLLSLQMASWKKAVSQYDVALNADNYFKVFFDYRNFKRNDRNYQSPNLSRLDKFYFPNLIVKTIRRFL